MIVKFPNHFANRCHRSKSKENLIFIRFGPLASNVQLIAKSKQQMLMYMTSKYLADIVDQEPAGTKRFRQLTQSNTDGVDLA